MGVFWPTAKVGLGAISLRVVSCVGASVKYSCQLFEARFGKESPITHSPCEHRQLSVPLMDRALIRKEEARDVEAGETLSVPQQEQNQFTFNHLAPLVL